MIAAILSVLGSSAVGSILGGIFALLNKKSDLLVKQLDLDQEKAKWSHELLLRDKDLEYAKIEAQGLKEVAVIEGDSRFEALRMGVISEGVQNERLDFRTLAEAGEYKNLFVWANFITQLIRPGITLIIAVSVIWLNFYLMLQIDWAKLNEKMQFDAAMQAIAWLTGQGSAILGYWFVSRGSSK